MKAHKRFLSKPPDFWANVRLISEKVGYSSDGVAVGASVEQIRKAFAKQGLNPNRIVGDGGDLTDLGKELLAYFRYRARVLNERVSHNLMDRAEAKAQFERIRSTTPGTKRPSQNPPRRLAAADRRAAASSELAVALLPLHSCVLAPLDPALASRSRGVLR